MNRFVSSIRKLKDEVTSMVKQPQFLVSVLFWTLTICRFAYADANAASDQWKNVIEFITTWVSRLGGGVILIGMIQFALAFKNDDAEAKTRGMQTVIAGCIVVAVGVSSDLFLWE